MDYVALRGKRRPLEQRFWEKVEKTDTCWNWLASLDWAGYGKFGDGEGGVVRAHRWSYTQMVGPIPAGMVLDHLCFNRRCVNPAHLEPVTQAENVRRWAVRITHCKRGHEYTESNTYIRDKGNGIRQCRRCHADAERERRRRG